MKIITITKGFSVEVDDEYYDFLMQWKWYAVKGKTTYYAARTQYFKKPDKPKMIYMHRQIMAVIDKNVFIDHKDRNGLNCQKNNLRIATISQNGYNKLGRGVSKYLGVSWNKKNKKWMARIAQEKKYKHIGLFESEDDAAIAYDEAAKIHHGEFANLNFKD